MPWLKLLHISAVILWSGALLYLTVAVANAVRPQADAAVDPRQHRLLRSMYTLVATPAALVAIASGTAIFLLHQLVVAWLLAKLVAVGLLVLGHGLCGMLVLRAERQAQGGPASYTRGLGLLVAANSVLWLVVIAWLVLAKPF